jgi:hypothetical protein
MVIPSLVGGVGARVARGCCRTVRGVAAAQHDATASFERAPVARRCAPEKGGLRRT